jgi:hypothetical protein
MGRQHNIVRQRPLQEFLFDCQKCLTDSEGNIFDTEDCNIWVVHAAIHRDPKYYIQADKFIPDRWLVEQGHPIYPSFKISWRSFETVQRSCVGQSLAMVAIKIALLMMTRDFDIKAVYSSSDRRKKSSRPGKNHEKTDEGKSSDAYPVYVLPREGYPYIVQVAANL